MKKKSLLIVAILVVITAIVAIIYLNGRQDVPAGNLAVITNGSETFVDPFECDEVDVIGTTINGKGEEKEVSETGVTLQSVLELAGVESGSYTTVKVISSDEFAAELTAEEVADSGIAFFIKDTDDDGTESIRLIVFGDSNSKRQVKDVSRIEIE